MSAASGRRAEAKGGDRVEAMAFRVHVQQVARSRGVLEVRDASVEL